MASRIQTECLKVFVKRKCGDYPLLQQIILQEPDQLRVHEFLIQCNLWLWLLAEGKAQRNLQRVGLPQDRPLIRK